MQYHQSCIPITNKAVEEIRDDIEKEKFLKEYGQRHGND